MIVYKFTKEGGKAPWGSGYIPLPKNSEPGDWIEAEGMLILCANGIHGFPSVLAMLKEGLFSEALWVAELDGEILGEGNNKVCARRGRLLYLVEGWHKRNIQLWLCDCAERVLHVYEDWATPENQPDADLRTAPRRLIEAVRNGEPTDNLKELAAKATWATWATWAAKATWATWATWAAKAAGAAEAAGATWATKATRATWAAKAAEAAGAAEAAEAAEREWQATRLYEYLTRKRGEPKP